METVSNESNRNKKYKAWCITIQGWENTPNFHESMAYLIYGQELAPTTGQQHLQVYVRFKNRVYFNAVKKRFPDGAHIERSRSNEKTNRDYCSKEKLFWEFGTYDDQEGIQGRRTDLQLVVEKIKSGSTLRQVAEQHATEFVKYHAGLTRLHQILAPTPPQTRQMTVTVLWGGTAVGKTHRVLTKYPGGYMIKDGRDPFGSYENEDIVIFDEYDYNKWTIQSMNTYCDKWKCSLDCRYQNKFAWWTKVFIMSNTNPFEWWPLEHQSLREAFWRRLTHIHHIHTQEEIIDLP